MNDATTRDTLIPASYPALEREVYLAQEPVTERETEVPPPSTLPSGLVLGVTIPAVEVL